MVSATAWGAAARSDEATLPGAGAGVSAGVHVYKPLWAELLVDVGWTAPSGVRLGLLPQLRVYVTPRDRGVAALSVAAGVGADVLPDPSLLLHGSAALDLHVSRDVAVRLEGGWISHGAPAGAARLGLGVVWSPRPPPPELPPVVAPDDGVWIPFPVCAWTDLDAASRFLRELEQEDPSAAPEPSEVASPEATGSDDPAPPEVAASEESSEEPKPPPRPAPEPIGTAVVVARPGDVVRVGEGVDVQVADDGVATLRGAPGFADVEVLGGGRRDAFETEVASDVVIWTRSTEPADAWVVFDLGGSDLDGGDRAALETLAARTGGWGWRVYGSYSPEGDEAANLALASRRAERVAEALISLGLPAEQVMVMPPETPDPTRSLEDQRAVRLEPVAPDGEAP